MSDVKYKFICGWEVTAANVHDSQVFLGLLAKNTSRDVWDLNPCKIINKIAMD